MSQVTSVKPIPSSLQSDNQVLTVIGTGRVTEFQCPCCERVTLEVGKLAEIEVCFCRQCNGFVMPNEICGSLIGNLRAAYTGIEQTPKPLDQKALEAQVKCPACREFMEVHPYYGPGNAVIDSCMHCKLVWFDEKELDQIIRAPGLRQAPIRRPWNTPEANLVREREETGVLIDRAFADAASSLVRSFFG